MRKKKKTKKITLADRVKKLEAQVLALKSQVEHLTFNGLDGDYESLVEYARKKAVTRNDFVESCAEFLDCNGYLTDRQVTYLRKVRPNKESSFLLPESFEGAPGA